VPKFPAFGKYIIDDDPADVKSAMRKNHKPGFWHGGMNPPEVFKPILKVDIKTGKVLEDHRKGGAALNAQIRS